MRQFRNVRDGTPLHVSDSSKIGRTIDGSCSLIIATTRVPSRMEVCHLVTIGRR